jgi:hypothetical protein
MEEVVENQDEDCFQLNVEDDINKSVSQNDENDLIFTID